MKKLLLLLLCVVFCFQLAACADSDYDYDDDDDGDEEVEEKDDPEDSDGEETSDPTEPPDDPYLENLQLFYDKVFESHELLDAVADTIYANWYDAIYNDAFGGDISTAVWSAVDDHEDDLDRIEELDPEISALFKEIKNGEHGELVKDIMSAYSDYYEFVVNVSGSYKAFSASKETLKKELASLLRELSYEL